MKKILIAIALLGLVLSGCGSAAPPKAKPGATTTAPSAWDKAQASLLAKQAAAASAAARMTRFEKAVKSCSALPASVLADRGKTITMTAETDSYRGEGSLPMDDVLCPLVALNMPTSISAKMSNTTSLMGMQTDTWDGVEVSWSYHPDNGFNVILVDNAEAAPATTEATATAEATTCDKAVDAIDGVGEAAGPVASRVKSALQELASDETAPQAAQQAAGEYLLNDASGFHAGVTKQEAETAIKVAC
ncbi:MAG: hypothetical protein IMZ75_00775 [Actinobacteria bacterium]|nr:hypothetical protein [Actinomycetota bacterium]